MNAQTKQMGEHQPLVLLQRHQKRALKENSVNCARNYNSNFVIFWAIVGFLAINHQKRKAAAAAGQMNETPGPATPTNANTMSPNIQSLPRVNYQDPGFAAQNIMPDDHQGVNIDQQIHPAVQA
ncbi:hypothetical protein MKW98_003756 [Papaver atlanticum]|uniref:Uncharacterized protein n=1 Tax=Papaver atlanticum TaxID=357466 RepID=A0AAD4T9E5_9MAGN|nr:hypothetical protein MKW98_003756 [Papaver atlanticum]